MKVRDVNGDVVVDVHLTQRNNPIVRVWAIGLLFDVSSIVQNPKYDSLHRFDYCMILVRKQIEQYQNDNKLENRRAARMLWPTPSAPISTLLTSRIMFALNMTHSIRD